MIVLRFILRSSMGSQLARLLTHWGALVGQAARTWFRMMAVTEAKTRLMMRAVAEVRQVVVRVKGWVFQPDLGGQRANKQDQGGELCVEC